jgi:hypothetical protein
MTKAIQELLLEIIPKQHRWKVTLLKQWPSIIGSLDGKVIIEKITDNCLYLGVCHPSWAQELFILSSVIKQKINIALAENRIENIKFRVMPQAQAKQVFLHIKKTNNTVKTNTSLSSKEKKCLSDVKNDILRTALEDFYIKCKNNQKGEN